MSAAGSKVSGSPGTPSAPGVTLRMSHGRNGCLMTARSRTFACASKGRARRAVPPTAPRAGATGQSTPRAGVGDHHLVGGRADGVDRRIASRRVVAVDHAEPRVGAVVEAAQHTTRCGTERVGTMSWRTPSGCRCRSWPAPGCRRFGVPAARGRRAAASACHRGCRHRPARRGLRAAAGWTATCCCRLREPEARCSQTARPGAAALRPRAAAAVDVLRIGRPARRNCR